MDTIMLHRTLHWLSPALCAVVLLALVPASAEAKTRVGRVTDVPVASSGTVNDDDVTKADRSQPLPKHQLGHRGPTDVSHAYEDHPVRRRS